MSSETSAGPLRVLFCIGVLQSNFDSEPAVQQLVVSTLKREFSDLRGKFGIDVLGTMDDDLLMVGSTTSFPWTSYILADVPDLETVAKVTGLLRSVEVGDSRLWKFLRIEARVGRSLFFGND
jgi:hypothetical protein